MLFLEEFLDESSFSAGGRPGDLLIEEDLVCVLLVEATGDLSEMSDLRDTLVGEVIDVSLAEAGVTGLFTKVDDVGVLLTAGDTRGDFKEILFAVGDRRGDL